MAGNNQNGEEPITNINVTPLVDITLVLLIIFMVTATFIVSPQIKVELPKAVTAETSDPQTFSIVLTKDGELYLNGTKTDEAQLEATIVERVKNNPDLQAVISADKMAYHGDVIKLIDMVRRNGVRKFALNVEAAPPPDKKATD
ncbi:MAG: biopolymer transporter ExbD [Myxococcales bacterium]|nr:biopolymer transporter ExbD [Myxococcales bacterium]